MPKPLNLLIVEDSEGDACLEVNQLESNGYEVHYHQVETRKDMLKSIQEGSWDLIISDHAMPEFTSGEALELYRECGLDIPFIIVSGAIGEEQAVAALKAGAHDYVFKGNLQRLAPVVERELREAEGRRDRKRLEDDILKAREALRESDERNRILIEESPVGIAILQEGVFSYANQPFLRIFGLDSEDEIVGRLPNDLIASEILEFMRARPLDTEDGRALHNYFEVTCNKKNGDIVDVGVWPRWINFLGSPATLVFVADRTEAISLREQIEQTQKMASLGTLVGGIAHDFNNMLQAIIGYSELLCYDRKKDDQGYRDLQTIIKTGRGGAELVGKLLSFGQQAQIFPVPIDLNHQISQLTTLITRTLPTVVQVELVLTNTPTTITGDRNQLDHVVMNLAINASEAMPNGGRVKIETKTVSLDDRYCKTHHGVKPGNYVMLSVSDTGRGMDKETVVKAFDPFFSTKERGSTRGTGLGLSVVKGIVQQQGGHITCESEPGKGTTFKVYFPAIEAPLMTSKTVGPTIQSGGTQTILVVEDNIPVAELEQRVLADAGYAVIVANNGQDALEIYQTRKEEISLVILDLLMPVMSGQDCLMELLKVNPSVKVLIASGYGTEDELHEEIGPLVKGFVHKPFAVAELLNETRSVLDGALRHALSRTL
jgi:two-component system, cell cycle sensor histidine kinase and response regulator CckA